LLLFYFAIEIAPFGPRWPWRYDVYKIRDCSRLLAEKGEELNDALFDRLIGICFAFRFLPFAIASCFSLLAILYLTGYMFIISACTSLV
jgi:hypothetical protein